MEASNMQLRISTCGNPDDFNIDANSMLQLSCLNCGDVIFVGNLAGVNPEGKRRATEPGDIISMSHLHNHQCSTKA